MSAARRVNCFVVHYHEIALKGENRPRFIRRLAENIEACATDLRGFRVTTPRGRIVVRLEPGTDWTQLRDRIGLVFGIANYSPAASVGSSLDQITSGVMDVVATSRFDSFRISARRAHKGFPLTSMELNQRLGRIVQEATGARVDLEAPAASIFVEVLQKETLVYLEKLPGPGGLPVGASARLCCLISGGIDSPVAAYRMMKRGSPISFVHFHSYPLLDRSSIEKAQELVGHLTRYQYQSRLHLLPFGEIQRQVVLSVPPPLRVVIYRRLMFRIAEEIARLEGALGLVTGESVGQVASQTVENIVAIEAAAMLPVLRPLIGFDKNEIMDQAQKIGTYEISIQPDQDCCRLFIPPHPAVRARLDDIERAERRLPIAEMIKAGVEQAERREFRFPKGSADE